MHNITTFKGENRERVSEYKYLGTYVGYISKAKEAEMRHAIGMCKARLQPLKYLAWSGQGAGARVLRIVYTSTSKRSN